MTTLIAAIKTADEFQINFLLENGIHHIDENNFEPLTTAFEVGNLHILKLLVTHGADIHYYDYYYDAVASSAENGHFHIVKYLIKNNAIVRKHGDDALILSAENGHFDIFKYLLKHGKYLVNHHGANILANTYAHYSINNALLRSATNGHFDIVKYLLKLRKFRKYLVNHEANIIADTFTRDSINDALIRSATNGHLRIVKYLVQLGADINSIEDIALINSCRNGHLDVIRYLVKHGADIHTDDDYLLLFSAYNNRHNIVKYLISQFDPDSIYEIDFEDINLPIIKEFKENSKTTILKLKHEEVMWFMYIVLLCDDYYKIGIQENEMIRFARILIRLPMDIQMVISNRICGKMDDNIPSKEFEKIFREIIYKNRKKN